MTTLRSLNLETLSQRYLDSGKTNQVIADAYKYIHGQWTAAKAT